MLRKLGTIRERVMRRVNAHIDAAEKKFQDGLVHLEEKRGNEIDAAHSKFHNAKEDLAEELVDSILSK